MKEKINEDHIKLTDTLKLIENDMKNIKGFEYYKFISQLFYPKNSSKSTKHYLVSIENERDYIPINLLAEKSSLDDAIRIFISYIKDKYPNIEYSESLIFNMIIYKNSGKINIKKYTLKELLTPEIKHVFFDWSNTISAQGLSNELFRTHDKKYLNNGIMELLENLKSRSIPTSIISNNYMKKNEFENHLNDMDMKKYFKHIILSGDGHQKKPHPDMFTEGVRACGMAPKYILYVGNNYIKDIMGAAENGYQTAYKINDKKGYSYNDIANYKISDFKELIDLI